jgi:hypothetical protein
VQDFNAHMNATSQMDEFAKKKKFSWITKANG